MVIKALRNEKQLIANPVPVKKFIYFSPKSVKFTPQETIICLKAAFRD